MGVTIYSAVSVSLITQVDDNLQNTAIDIIINSRVDKVGELVVATLPSLDLPTDVYTQFWGRDGRLRATSPNISTYKLPLDPTGLTIVHPYIRDVKSGNLHLRVLTVPLVAGERLVGNLQVAEKVNVIDTTLTILLRVIIVGTLAAVSLVALAAWFSTKRAMDPLEQVTQTALQITHANDLSRRIPYAGKPGDEIGQLINAFNQTLSRMENLFNTQRRFMADVGHELRTPLTVIKGKVSLIRRFGAMDEESLQGIDNEVDRLTRLVGDLLLLAQAESGKLPLDRRLVELDSLVLEVMGQMRVLAGEKLQLKLGDIDQVLVCGDKDRLKQVLVNLLGNAISYTQAGGEVVVGLGKTGNQARLTVRDNGPGIPVVDLPHVFERFYRGEKSRTRTKDGKGFGLGLSIAYWIVHNHGGKIDVDSIEGQGTTFCIWLPLADQDCQKA